MPIIIGIDPSLTATAMVCLTANLPGQQAATDVMVIRSKLRGCARLSEIQEAVVTFVDSVGPELVLIEGFAYNSKGRSVFEMGGLGWLLRWTFVKMEQNFLVVPPAILKVWATGKGNSAKEVMLREVFRKWQYEALDNNDADAYALAQLGMHVSTAPESWTKKLTELYSKCEVGA